MEEAKVICCEKITLDGNVSNLNIELVQFLFQKTNDQPESQKIYDIKIKVPRLKSYLSNMDVVRYDRHSISYTG